MVGLDEFSGISSGKLSWQKIEMALRGIRQRMMSFVLISFLRAMNTNALNKMSLRVKEEIPRFARNRLRNLIREGDCRTLRVRNDNVKAFNAFVLIL
jgi:hypothetical protein